MMSVDSFLANEDNKNHDMAIRSKSTRSRYTQVSNPTTTDYMDTEEEEAIKILDDSQDRHRHTSKILQQRYQELIEEYSSSVQ